MEEYKQSWALKHGKVWEYTKDAHDEVKDVNTIEQDYKAFKKRKHDEDPDVLKS